jgi:hypothetical protein
VDQYRLLTLDLSISKISKFEMSFIVILKALISEHADCFWFAQQYNEAAQENLETVK